MENKPKFLNNYIEVLRKDTNMAAPNDVSVCEIVEDILSENSSVFYAKGAQFIVPSTKVWRWDTVNFERYFVSLSDIIALI